MVGLHFLVGIIASIFSILSYFAPIRQFLEIWSSESSENYDGFPYIATLFSCCLWMSYGFLHPRYATFIIIANATGILTQFIYLYFLIKYYPEEKKVKYSTLVLVALVVYAILMVVHYVAIPEGVRRTSMGYICDASSVIAYAAPFTAVIKTMKTKSVEHVPFLLILTFFIKGFLWVMFASFDKDFHILVPNAIGIVLGAVQLLVYIIYKYSKPASTEDVMVNVEEGRIVDDGNQLELKTNVDISLQALPTQSLKIGSPRNPSLSRQHSYHKRISPI